MFGKGKTEPQPPKGELRMFYNKLVFEQKSKNSPFGGWGAVRSDLRMQFNLLNHLNLLQSVVKNDRHSLYSAVKYALTLTERTFNL